MSSGHLSQLRPLLMTFKPGRAEPRLGAREQVAPEVGAEQVMAIIMMEPPAAGGGALELGLEFRAEAEAEAKAHSKRNSNSPSVDFRLAEAVARRVVGSGLRSRRQMSSRPAERLFGAPLFGFRRRTRKPVGWRSFGARSSLNSN